MKKQQNIFTKKNIDTNKMWKQNISDHIYKGISKSFRTGRLERELQMVQLSATM
jgi:hypothetical protein